MRFQERIGILGGGQLGRMLAEAAARLGLCPVIFSSEPDCPASKISSNIVVGDFEEPQKLENFLENTAAVIYENEFIPYEVVKKAAFKKKTAFIPSLDTLFIFQDKLRQKELLDKLKIPTAPYEKLIQQDLSEWLSRVLQKFNGNAILKWAQLGYDGKGIFHLTPQSKEKALEFCKRAEIKKIPLYAEAYVPFKRELALVACYSTKGKFSAYPLVISKQEKGICKTVYGPAVSLDVPETLQKKAFHYAKLTAESSQLFGVFAIEFFETPSGELWVNEIAPRVHNSGHYTLMGAQTSQFENHLRAALGIPLGSTETAPAFAMQNLIGPPEISCDEQQVSLPLPPPSVQLYWYGKGKILPWRKLGHLNSIRVHPSQMDEMLQELSQIDERWMNQIRMELGAACL
jgi:5-(carboxyamino)imidazole ribonucleotide synthase